MHRLNVDRETDCISDKYIAYVECRNLIISIVPIQLHLLLSEI